MEPILIYPYMKIAQLYWLPCSWTKNTYSGKYKNQEGATPSRAHQDRKFKVDFVILKSNNMCSRGSMNEQTVLELACNVKKCFERDKGHNKSVEVILGSTTLGAFNSSDTIHEIEKTLNNNISLSGY